MRRFTGTVEPLGVVDVAPLQRWVTAIPWEDWPQQHRLSDGGIRPAMVNDPDWHGFYTVTTTIVKQVQAWVPRWTAPQQRLLSVVMPGHDIPPHVDKHTSRWWGRIHVPILSDPASRFLVEDQGYHLEPGQVYVVNTLRTHGVDNTAGQAPRVHLVVDWEW